MTAVTTRVSGATAPGAPGRGDLAGLTVAAWGVAELDASSGQIRETRIRAMDPSCWAVLDAVGTALKALATASEDVASAVPEGSRVGVIAVSEEATLETLRGLSAEAETGRFSPRQFVAASPGTLIGVSCSAYGFGGPSLLLTMPPDRGRPFAVELARQWLGGHRPQAEAVALVLHRRSPDGRHRAECLWLVPAAGHAPEAERPLRTDRSACEEEQP